MTRLQKMLSKVQTVEQLAELLKLSPSYITGVTGISKDGEKLIMCDWKSACKCCAIYQNGGCAYDPSQSLIYLNSEIPETDHKSSTNYSTKIIEMRENARKALMNYIRKQALKSADSSHCYDILIHNIILLETIGLFNKGELREQIIEEIDKL